MPRPSPEAARLAAAYRIGVRFSPGRSLPGDRPARGTGAAGLRPVEFATRAVNLEDIFLELTEGKVQ